MTKIVIPNIPEEEHTPLVKLLLDIISQQAEIIEKQAESDARIRYVFRQENGHISACSNSALELVSGDYFALLDHDDILHPAALYFVAKEINQHPDVEVIYSDEDKLDKEGNVANHILSQILIMICS